MTKNKILLFCIILVLALGSRLILLEARPLHHDEGNNFYFAQILSQSGEFRYNPENFHGPLYFFMLFLSFLIFGISEFSLRLPVVVFGVLLTILPFFITIKRKFPYFLAALFILLSPSLTYFSRYSIHEMLFVLLGLTLWYLVFLILETKSLQPLPYAALILALLLATKETSIITLAGIGLLILLHLPALKKLEWRKHATLVLASAYLFGVMYVALYSTFFTNFPGVIKSLEAYAPWIARSKTDIGHIKPWYYYILLIIIYEAPIFFLALVGAIQGWRRKNALIRNLSLYAAFIFLVYSLIPYKMPWLVINITAPLCFLAGYGLKKIPWPIIQKIAATVSFIFLAASCIYLNYLNTWQKNNWYAYVHSDIDMLRLVGKIQALAQYDPKIAMVSDVYWPLPFYLREYSVDYFGHIEAFQPGDYALYSTTIVNDSIFDPETLPEDYAYEKFTLRENVVLDVIYKK